jgi:hypothetical protein
MRWLWLFPFVEIQQKETTTIILSWRAASNKDRIMSDDSNLVGDTNIDLLTKLSEATPMQDALKRGKNMSYKSAKKVQ